MYAIIFNYYSYILLIENSIVVIWLKLLIYRERTFVYSFYT